MLILGVGSTCFAVLCKIRSIRTTVANWYVSSEVMCRYELLRDQMFEIAHRHAFKSWSFNSRYDYILDYQALKTMAGIQYVYGSCAMCFPLCFGEQMN